MADMARYKHQCTPKGHFSSLKGHFSQTWGGGGMCPFRGSVFDTAIVKTSTLKKGCDIEMLQKGVVSIVFKGCCKGVAAKRRVRINFFKSMTIFTFNLF